MLLLLLSALGTAWASKPALEPLNRVHAGVSASDTETLGVSLGLDSRLTRLVYVDVGGFVSPLAFPDDLASVDTSKDAGEYLFLRHGLFFSPGLRVPHRDGEGLQWDALLRFGFAAVWFTDTEPEVVGIDTVQMEIEAAPGVFGGLDAQIRKDRWGLKLSGKSFVSRTYSGVDDKDVVVVKPQISAEVLWQW